MLSPDTVVIEQPKYLVRIWGKDEDVVRKLREPDAIEDQNALCYWFMTPAERKAFIDTFPENCWVMRATADPDEDGVNTRACTWVRVTLRLPDGREGTFEQSYGYGYPVSGVHYMWEEGNYSCDCNRRLFLARYCGIDPEIDDLQNDDLDIRCGDTITLVSLDIFYTYLGD